MRIEPGRTLASVSVTTYHRPGSSIARGELGAIATLERHTNGSSCPLCTDPVLHAIERSAVTVTLEAISGIVEWARLTEHTKVQISPQEVAAYAAGAVTHVLALLADVQPEYIHDLMLRTNQQTAKERNESVEHIQQENGRMIEEMIAAGNRIREQGGTGDGENV